MVEPQNSSRILLIGISRLVLERKRPTVTDRTVQPYQLAGKLLELRFKGSLYSKNRFAKERSTQKRHGRQLWQCQRPRLFQTCST